MKISDVMTEKVFTVTVDTPLKTVATRMLEYGISGLPVVDGERVIGVVSETDILYKERTEPARSGLVDWLVHYAEDPPLAKLEARTAGEAMTTPAVTVASGRPVAHAAERMLDLGIDRLPVVDSGRLVGILTRADLVRAFVRDDAEIERDIREDGIARTFWMSSDELAVTVKNGDVRLEGGVASEEVAESIAAFTRQVPGVVSVDSKLTWSDLLGPCTSVPKRSLHPRRTLRP